MVAEAGFERGHALLRRHLADAGSPSCFRLLGRDWDLLDGVFNPTYTPVTALFTSWLPYPKDGKFLEVGSGTGVTSVVAAQSGCRAVTALDISAAAVANTQRNVDRHGVGDRVRVLRSDLFSNISPEERFDLVYWNSNFAEPPEGFVNKTDLYHAFFDPRYNAHRRFVSEAPRHITTGGRVMLGFSDIGNIDLLGEVSRRAGIRLEVLRSERHRAGDVEIEFQLIELRRHADAAGCEDSSVAAGT